MALRNRLTWLWVSVLVLGAPRAFAQPVERRVALVEPGAELEAAARVALDPWHVTIVVVAGPSPGAMAPASNAAARDLALANDAHAVVWISEHQGRYGLWAYDLQANHGIERELSYAPPFDGAAAAAVALSVKTLLRHSVVAPEDERFGRQRASGSTSTRVPSVPSVPTTSPSTSTTTATGSAPPSTRTATTNAGSKTTALEMMGGAGVRLGAMKPGVVEPRFGIGVDWWPSRETIGIGVAVAAGPAVAIHEGDFDGRLFDVALQFAVSARRAVATHARVAAGLGLALHVLALEGELSPTRATASALRTWPALALALQLDWAIAEGARAGLFLEPSYMLHAERYLVGDDLLLELTHLRIAGGLAVRFALL